MLQVNPRNIISISEAKTKLNSLTNKLNGEPLIVSKNGQPKLGIVSLDYLETLQKKADFAEMQRMQMELKTDFRSFLKQEGYKPEKLTDEEVYKIIDKI